MVKGQFRMKRKRGYNSISDVIYEKFLDLIVSGRLGPGEKITELGIAEAEGVSRAPVREALKRLCEDRLVTLVPRSGCHVCEITREDVDEIFEIRKRLECLALEYAMGHLDIDRVQNLKGRFLKCSKLDDGKVIAEEVKLDGQLHDMIHEACNSRNLQDLLAKLIARVRFFRARGTRNAAKARVALAGHIDILDAIIQGDRKRALKLLAEHIDVSRENSLEDLERR